MITLKQIFPGQEKIVQELLESAPSFQQFTQGTKEVSLSAGHELLTELPPNCESNQKYVLLIEENEKNLGVIDLIDGYPQKGTVYIGLFLLRENLQKKNTGRLAYVALEDFIQKNKIVFKAEKLRLAFLESNPVEGFWLKMGFVRTGESKPYLSGELKTTAILMEKNFS